MANWKRLEWCTFLVSLGSFLANWAAFTMILTKGRLIKALVYLPGCPASGMLCVTLNTSVPHLVGSTSCSIVCSSEQLEGIYLLYSNPSLSKNPMPAFEGVPSAAFGVWSLKVMFLSLRQFPSKFCWPKQLILDTVKKLICSLLGTYTLVTVPMWRPLTQQ